MDKIADQAETVASVVLLVSSVGLTVILQNPILANTLAFPVATAVKIVAQRAIAEWAIRPRR